MMFWLVVLGGIQILGFGFTLTRLAYDEWKQKRSSRKAPVAMEDRRRAAEYGPWTTATT
jgi:hypothetical protein